MRAVVAATRVGDLDSVRVRGEAGRRNPVARNPGSTRSDSLYGLKITRISVLQQYSDRAIIVNPFDLEKLISLDIVIAVSELNSIGKGSKSANEDSSRDLHVDGEAGLGIKQ